MTATQLIFLIFDFYLQAIVPVAKQNFDRKSILDQDAPWYDKYTTLSTESMFQTNLLIVHDTN